MSSSHLFLGLPLILPPIGFHSNILLGILPPSIRVTCPSQAILLLFINLTMSAFPISSFSSQFFLILQIPFSSCTGPKSFLNIFRSNILNCYHFDLLMSRPQIRMLLQVLLGLYIFLVLNFYLMLLISLVLHTNSNISRTDFQCCLLEAHCCCRLSLMISLCFSNVLEEITKYKNDSDVIVKRGEMLLM